MSSTSVDEKSTQIISELTSEPQVKLVTG